MEVSSNVVSGRSDDIHWSLGNVLLRLGSSSKVIVSAIWRRHDFEPGETNNKTIKLVTKLSLSCQPPWLRQCIRYINKFRRVDFDTNGMDLRVRGQRNLTQVFAKGSRDWPSFPTLPCLILTWHRVRQEAPCCTTHRITALLVFWSSRQDEADLSQLGSDRVRIHCLGKGHAGGYTGEFKLSFVPHTPLQLFTKFYKSR